MKNDRRQQGANKQHDKHERTRHQLAVMASA